MLNIINANISEINPYENNPRYNNNAVDAVAKSIEKFGFKVPIVIDSDNTIVTGHTRYKAAIKLNLTDIPCVVADDLTPEQIRAFRIADNKVSEISAWDYDLLKEELSELNNINFESIGFSELEIQNILNDTSFINDLVNENFAENNPDKEKQTFEISLSFPLIIKDDIDVYLREHGKNKLVEHIINHVRSVV